MKVLNLDTATLCQQNDRASGSPFIVCCFFTPNYAGLADNLKRTLDTFNLNYILQPVVDRGYWEANTRIKPEFILDCLTQFPDHNVLYIDADAAVKKPLDFFAHITEDMAIYVAKPSQTDMSHKYLASTIFIKNNDIGKKLVTEWVAAQANAKATQVDQDSILVAVETLGDSLSIKPLPLGFAKIFDKDYAGEIYIEQYQASRGQTKLRRQRIRRRNLILIALLSLALMIIGWSMLR